MNDETRLQACCVLDSADEGAEAVPNRCWTWFIHRWFNADTVVSEIKTNKRDEILEEHCYAKSLVLGPGGVLRSVDTPGGRSSSFFLAAATHDVFASGLMIVMKKK
jgi:hypothetical protein